jgi:hypothetical protein
MRNIFTLLLALLLIVSAEAQNIVQAEYFIGADPGPGNGTPIAITSGNSIQLTSNFSTSGINPGFHSLAIRTRGASGIWSNTSKRSFFVEAASVGGGLIFHEIIDAEYFVDNDPGPGNGIPIDIASGTDIEINAAALANLPIGFHKICVRTKSTSGLWSASKSRHFVVQPASSGGSLTYQEIVSAEYFIDSDPGPGMGIPINMEAGIEVDLSETFTANLSPGFHKVCIRSKSSAGLWSPTKSRLFVIKSTINAGNPFIIDAAEFFINNDPGPGNGTAISITPADSISVSGEVDLTQLPYGNNTISIRFRSGAGLWSNTATQSFNYCDSVPALAYFTYTIDGFQVSYLNTSGFGAPNISWSLPGSNPSGINNPSQTLSTPGTYQACMSLSSVCGSDTDCQFVVIADTIQITSVNPDQVFPGDIIDVSFVTNFTTFDALNVFTLLLSDVQGSFENATVLAELATDTGGVFENVLIPLSLQAGCYTLKVVSSLPVHSSPEDATLKVNSVTFEPGNYAVSFDGIDDRIDAGSLLGDHDFTVSFWVKPDGSVNQTGAIIDMQNDLALYENPAEPNNYVLLHLLQFDLLPDAWNHVTVTMDAATDTRRVYLFGQLVEENQWPYAPQSNYHMLLGSTNCSYCGGNFKGLIDEFKCWNVALDDDAIFQQVNNAPDVNDPSLKVYYTFDEGCFSEALDNSLFGNDAALLNGTQYVPSDLIQGSTDVYPSEGGNNGWVTLHIEGNSFPDSVIVMLSNPSLGEIVADTAIVSLNNELIVAYLDLSNQALGLYDVIVQDFNGNSYNYPESFTIVPADTTGGIEIEILGQNTIRDGGRHVFFIVYKNTSNVNLPADIRLLKCNYTDWMGFDDQQLMYHYQQLPIALCDRYISDEGVTYLDEWLSPGIQYVIPIYAISTADGTRDVNCGELSPFILEGAYPVRTDDEGANAGGPFGGHNYIDGCSAPDELIPVVNFLVSADVDWNQIFLPACMNHDLCYQQCYRPGTWERAQAICDLNMLDGMCDICFELYGDWEIGDPFPPGFDVTLAFEDALINNGPYQKCLQAAALYYAGLRLFGESEGFNPDQAYCTGDLEHPAPQDSGENFLVLDCNCPARAICFKPRRIGAYDPNIKIGPDLYQSNTMEWAYSIYFENADSATAPAQNIRIIDTLDTQRYDLESFAFTGFGFGESVRLFTETTDNNFAEVIDLPSADSTLVSVSGFMDPSTGIVQWQLTAIDSITSEPLTGVFDGFLPPNDSTGRGQGFVLFRIAPLEGLTTGDSIRNRASIYFDYNDPITTPYWTNVLDFSPPTSYIAPLEALQLDTLITLHLFGEDSLLTDSITWSIYVSINGSEYTLWLNDLTDSIVVYSGSPGNTYSFYSIATDAAGNEETAPIQFDASTYIYSPGEPISYNYTNQQPSCVNQHDASITIEINGNSPFYHVIWNGTEGANTLSEIGAGTYLLQVIDALNAIVLDTLFEISNPDAISLSLTTSPALCFGEASGSASVLAAGGTGSLQIDWQGANPQALAAGQYTVAATDANGCVDDTLFTISEPNAITIQLVDLQDATSDCNGSITIDVSGGVPPYTQSWNDDQNQTGTTAVNLCEGSYSVVVTDANGCDQNATFDILLHTEELTSAGSQLVLWPNPAKDFCTIDIYDASSSSVHVQVSNALGQICMAPQVAQLVNGFVRIQMDFSLLAGGNYMIEAIGANRTETLQFILIKDN